MNNLAVYIKVLVAAVSSIVSFLVDGLGLAVVVLLTLMAIDIVTGLMVGYANKELKSSTGRKGLIRKTYTILLIAACYLLDKAIFGTGYLGDGIATTFILNEILSICENGGKLGVPIPKRLSDAIEVLKGKSEANKKGQD